MPDTSRFFVSVDNFYDKAAEAWPTATEAQRELYRFLMRDVEKRVQQVEEWRRRPWWKFW